jgi:hypothetical protein
MIACEEQRCGRDIIGRSQAPCMDALDQPRLTLGAITLPLALRGGIGTHKPGRNRIAGNAEAAKVL